MSTPYALPPAAPDARSRTAWLCLRLVLAGLIAAHGWMRFAGGGVGPFGEWLTSQHLPFGFVIAAAITALEVVGTPLYAAGWFVPALSGAYASIYLAGIAMVHATEGWFVVGAGRNGVELQRAADRVPGVRRAAARHAAPPVNIGAGH